VFLKLWSGDHRWSAPVPQVVCSGLQAVSEEKGHCKYCIRHRTNEKHTHTCLLKLPLLVDLQQKVGELVLSITYCPKIIILENTLNWCPEIMLLW
jgi:hypothetical protein